MWSEGRLSAGSLRGYAKEYFYLVSSIPDIVESIYLESNDNKKIHDSLVDERGHVGLWIEFANTLGVGKQELERHHASQKTRNSVGLLRYAASTFDGGVAAMYAYEVDVPRISRTKLDGLSKFYNITSEDATEYHRVHEVIDLRHTAAWRNLLMQLPADQHERAFSASILSLVAQNLILDGVYDKYVLDRP